ncbi:MAG TPA: hypothetical protein VKE30_07495 [Chthoniobacterales bacterium]|nr:hypothetical protein [Chthoniobacterales bacterium]
MKRATKFLVILLCVSLCAGGVVLSVKEGAKANRARAKVLPINNRAKQKKVWIWS